MFRDLRSTNGSAIDRNGRRVPVDAAARWEIALADGDTLLLGNPNDPVRISVRFADEADEDLGDRLIASRSIMDLAAVTNQIEREPADAVVERGAARDAVVFPIHQTRPFLAFVPFNVTVRVAVVVPIGPASRSVSVTVNDCL